MGCITAVWIISRFLSGPVYSYHGYFRFGSGFMPVFVNFYGSLMAHGYGFEKSRVVTARFNRDYVPRCSSERNDLITVSSTWELTPVGTRYS